MCTKYGLEHHFSILVRKFSIHCAKWGVRAKKTILIFIVSIQFGVRNYVSKEQFAGRSSHWSNLMSWTSNQIKVGPNY